MFRWLRSSVPHCKYLYVNRYANWYLFENLDSSFMCFKIIILLCYENALVKKKILNKIIAEFETTTSNGLQYLNK